MRASIKDLLNIEFQNYLTSKCNAFTISPQKVLIDFSSPNIAKPFHPGHIRATLLGHFIANINSLFGHKVHRINYLGDWGTQFGYLLYGLKKFNNNYENYSINCFYETYIKSYQQFQNIESQNSIKKLIMKLENDDEELRIMWRNVKQISIGNLKLIYKRLGISFDSFEFESDYSKSCMKLIEQVQEKTNSISNEDGTIFYILDNDRKIPLITSEGASLYLTRDIAAAISRQDRYRPDRIHYVVENGQSFHFETLKKILTDMGYQINTLQDQKLHHTNQPSDFHIKFGRVLKMSTRKGNVIFLDEILDHAKALMIKKLKNEKNTTKTNLEKLDCLAENLGKTVIFCEFLRTPRQNPFDFVWDRDNLGFRLQYCRIRLNSLETRCFDQSINPCLENCFHFDSYEYFENFPRARQLVNHMDRWHDVLFKCYMESESCYLMIYITKMVGLVHDALKEIRVVDCPSKNEAKIRLKLFSVAKYILDVNYGLLGFPEIDII